MKISSITASAIIFDNGNKITFDHYQECCEHNYADFSYIEDDVYRNADFDPNLEFEFVNESGFRFGNNGKYIFVPCYSEQNGYYTGNIDIYYNSKRVVNGKCELDWC